MSLIRYMYCRAYLVLKKLSFAIRALDTEIESHIGTWYMDRWSDFPEPNTIFYKLLLLSHNQINVTSYQTCSFFAVYPQNLENNRTIYNSGLSGGKRSLLGDTDHSTSQSSASVSGRLTEFMTSFSKVINIGMNL